MDNGVLAGGVIIFIIIIVLVISLIIFLTVPRGNNNTTSSTSSTTSSTTPSPSLNTKSKSVISKTNIVLKNTGIPHRGSLRGSLRKVSSVPLQNQKVPLSQTSIVPPKSIFPTYYLGSGEDSCDDSNEDLREFNFHIESDTEFEHTDFEEDASGGYFKPVVINPGVIDIIETGSGPLYLYDSGLLYLMNEAIKPQGLDSRLISIFNIGDNVGGLSESGKIYIAVMKDKFMQISKHYMYKDSDLSSVLRKDDKIISVSPTLTGRHFSIQTNKSLIMFDSNGNEVERISKYPSTQRRVYGMNLTTYIDINLENKTAKLSTDPPGSFLSGVIDAIVTSDGSAAVLTQSRSNDYGYTKMKYIGGTPYYL